MGLNLMTMCGANRVDRMQVFDADIPPATRSHCPIRHSTILEEVEHNLERIGMGIVQEAHALSHEGLRYFGMLEIAQEDGGDFSTIVGLRNSNDKAFAAGLVVGSGVMVCDNLCFSGEIKVARKHTRFIMDSIPDLMAEAIDRVVPVRELQQNRIEKYKTTELAVSQVNDMLIHAFDDGVISSAKIGQVLTEYRDPRHHEFKEDGNTVWRLMNAFTEIMKPRENGHDLFTLPAKTQKLHGILDAACGMEEPLALAEA